MTGLGREPRYRYRWAPLPCPRLAIYEHVLPLFSPNGGCLKSRLRLSEIREVFEPPCPTLIADSAPMVHEVVATKEVGLEV